MTAKPHARLLLVWGLHVLAPTLPVLAQDIADPLEVLTRTKSICAGETGSAACLFGRAQTAAIMANAVAEAGNSLDRGTFIEPVRVLLADPNPEIRTSALYALAKLGPDASDTPAIRALALDPVSNVRGGAWAAAARSSDPAARRIALRVTERPLGTGYTPGATAFDPAALGLTLPEGLDYLWLAADLREQGQVHFLASVAPNELLSRVVGADGPARPLSVMIADDPVAASALAPFLDPTVYGSPQVMSYPATAELPSRHLVVFQDLAFDRTGIAVILADGRSLVSWPLGMDAPMEPSPDAPLDDAAFDAALLGQSGFKREADPDESDLFMAIVAAGGYGAEDYLEIYPGGAYAETARAYLADPRILLAAPSFMDTEDIVVNFANLPQGAAVDVRIVPKAPAAEVSSEQRVQDANRESARFEPEPWLVPGVYWAIATVYPADGSPEFALVADFSLTPGQAVLVADKADYAPGELISVRFSGMSGDGSDYVSTATAGSPNEAFLAYAYTAGAREGSLTLTAPAAPGAYELRAFFREDESLIRARVSFTVSGGMAPSDEGTPARSAATQGSPSPEARATLALDKASYAAGETLTVSYADMFGHAQDYIATAPEGAPNSSYLQYRYTEGAIAGTTTLSAPTEPGTYEVRAFFMEDEAILRASLPFTVAGGTAQTPAAGAGAGFPSQDARARLTLDKKSYAPGEVIAVTFADMFGHAQDYVCTTPAGAPNSSYLQYRYTDGAKDGTTTLTAPIEPGIYELRAFFMEDEAILRATVSFTVR